MKKVAVLGLVIVFLILFLRFFLAGSEDEWICEYGRWVKHGNPSAPMPTSGCGSKLVDEVEQNLTDSSLCYSPNGNKMTYKQALEKATAGCIGGTLEDTHFCNDGTGTWWIDFTPDAPKEGCSPACVIFVDTGETEINWRCTGLREPSI